MVFVLLCANYDYMTIDHCRLAVNDNANLKVMINFGLSWLVPTAGAMVKRPRHSSPGFTLDRAAGKIVLGAARELLSNYSPMCALGASVCICMR